MIKIVEKLVVKNSSLLVIIPDPGAERAMIKQCIIMEKQEMKTQHFSWPEDSLLCFINERVISQAGRFPENS